MADTATKIRIFSLAKELGMDSKVLIEHCRAAGLTVKGSALASISPEEKELVLRQMGNARGGEGENVSAAAVAETPSREDVVRDIGARMRSIRTMVPRDRATATATAGQVEESAPDTGSAEEGDSIESPDVAADVQAETAPVDSAPDSVAPEAEVVETVPDGSAVVVDSPVDRGASHKREDYVPLRGATRSTVREMRPRGTPTHSDQVAAREGEKDKEKDRGRPSLPGLAPLPAFTVKEPKKAAGEPKAQKP